MLKTLKAKNYAAVFLKASRKHCFHYVVRVGYEGKTRSVERGQHQQEHTFHFLSAPPLEY
jgi:hypothetical protein